MSVTFQEFERRMAEIGGVVQSKKYDHLLSVSPFYENRTDFKYEIVFQRPTRVPLDSIHAYIQSIGGTILSLMTDIYEAKFEVIIPETEGDEKNVIMGIDMANSSTSVSNTYTVKTNNAITIDSSIVNMWLENYSPIEQDEPKGEIKMKPFTIVPIQNIETYNDRVVKVTFVDNTFTKSVCSKNDHFDLDVGITICLMKKLLGGTNPTKAYNDLIRQAHKVMEDKALIEKKTKEAIAEEKKRQKKIEEKKAKRKQQRIDEYKDIHKQAFVEAMKEVKAGE